MIASYPSRRFQIWEYRVSHASLLIRSPKGDESVDNIDVVFVCVDYLAMPQLFDDLDVDRGCEDDRQALFATLGAVDLERLFVLVSGGRRYPVVAVSCRVSQNSGDIFESPL